MSDQGPEMAKIEAEFEARMAQIEREYQAEMATIQADYKAALEILEKEYEEKKGLKPRKSRWMRVIGRKD